MRTPDGFSPEPTWNQLRVTEGQVTADLGLKPSAAVHRYVRALKRLKDVFQGMPGGIEGIRG